MELAELRAAHPEHRAMATALRMLAADAVQAAKSGHPGMPLGMADVATVLVSKRLPYDAADPAWPDRDRFVLSAVHGSMLRYGLPHLTGHPGMTPDEPRRFRQLGAKTAGPPEFGHAPGVETTTGLLGQGLANAGGMAIAEEALRARFGRRMVVDRASVIARDGCLTAGIVQEAIGLAGRQRPSRLIVPWDDNRISIDGAVSLSDVTDQTARFRASGWAVPGSDGHDPAAIEGALRTALEARRPVLIAGKTRIGFGAPTKEWTAASHARRWARRGLPGRARRWQAEGADIGRPALSRHPQGLRDGVRGHQPDHARDARRLGRPDGIEQYPDRGSGGVRTGQPRRRLHPVQLPRARHGRGDERQGAAWRGGARGRDVPRVLGPHKAGDALVGADGAAGGPHPDP